MLSFYFRVFKWLSLAILVFNLSIFCEISSYTVNIIYPWEGKNISNVSKSFVFGNVSPFISTIIVNGQEIKVNPNGTFIAYVAISSANPFFIVEAGNSVYKRKVVLGERKKDINKDNPFELLISSQISLKKGENNICVNFRGKEKSKVRLSIEDIVKDEIYDDGNGFFEYCFDLFNKKVGFYDLELKYLEGDLKGEKLVLKNFLNIVDDYFYVETTTDNVVLKNEANGYIIFISSGVGLYCDMFDGLKYRVVLDNIKLWVDKDKVVYKKSSSNIVKSRVSTIRLHSISDNKVLAKIYLSTNKVPFSIWQDNKKLFLQLYNTIPNINWIVYSTSDKYTDNVIYKQLSDRSVLISFSFNDDLWGYDVNYSTENTLDMEFKFRPLLKGEADKPLAGLSIIIDPGHSPKNEPPWDGAVGPSGSLEYVVNLEISKKLYDLFKAAGANVFMTRYTNDKSEQVPLSERPRIAKRINADIYLSIHNNAIADGEDPYIKPRGFQIYYYHPHSKKLAYYIHRSFVKNIPLPDEGLRFGDYMVARITQMPSVLIENAYLILPQQEEMLLDPLWQQRFAQAIFDGVLDFLREK